MRQDTKRTYIIKAELKSPLFISSGSEAGNFREIVKSRVHPVVLENSGGGWEHGYRRLLDKPVVERPVIPGTTLKGRLRDNYRRLVGTMCSGHIKADEPCTCDVCSMFGCGGYMPSRVSFSDLVLAGEDNAPSMGMRSGVSIDRYLRTARDGALVFSNVLEEGVFVGEFDVYPLALKEGRDIEMLMAAFRMIDAIGGGKSRGWGFVDMDVKEKPKAGDSVET